MQQLVGRLLRTRPHDYAITTATFPQLDLARVAEEMRLEEKGRQRGEANLPPAEGMQLDDVEQAITARIEAETKQAFDLATDQLRIYRERAARLDPAGNAFEVKRAALELVAEFRKETNLGLDTLYQQQRRVRELAHDVHAFRDEARLRRSAHYSPNPNRPLSFLFALGAIEVALNGFILGDAAELGLAQGAIYAFVIALLNVGLAAFVGWWPMRQLWHRHPAHKLIGLATLVVWLGIAIACNLAVGHYRQLMSASGEEAALAAAIQHFRADPLGITDFTAWILTGLGMLFATVALKEGLDLDDRYPGYGNVARRHDAALQQFLQTKQNLIEGLTDLKDQGLEALGHAREDVSVRHEEYMSIAGGRDRLADQHAKHLDYLERSQAYLLSVYREANRRARRGASVPARFDAPVQLERRPLPPENDEGARRRADALEAETLKALGLRVEEVTQSYVAAFERLARLEETVREGTDDARIQKAAY
jgi:hypothetical protein